MQVWPGTSSLPMGLLLARYVLGGIALLVLGVPCLLGEGATRQPGSFDVLWSYTEPGKFGQIEAGGHASDGSIYLLTTAVGAPDHLTKLSPQGTVFWRRTVPGSANYDVPRVSVAPNGQAFVVLDFTSTITCIDPDGTCRWTSQLTFPPGRSSMFPVPLGLTTKGLLAVYAACGIALFDQRGVQCRWIDTPSTLNDVHLAPDDSLLCDLKLDKNTGSCTRWLTRLDFTGRSLSTTYLSNELMHYACTAGVSTCYDFPSNQSQLSPDGALVVQLPSRIALFDNRGKLRWSLPHLSPGTSGAAFGQSALYINGDTGLTAISLGGEELWCCDQDFTVRNSQVAANGLIYSQERQNSPNEHARPERLVAHAPDGTLLNELRVPTPMGGAVHLLHCLSDRAILVQTTPAEITAFGRKD